MSIKIYCNICDEVCGIRNEITFRLVPGATVEIVATCRKCNQPPPKPGKDFDHSVTKKEKVIPYCIGR